MGDEFEIPKRIYLREIDTYVELPEGVPLSDDESDWWRERLQILANIIGGHHYRSWFFKMKIAQNDPPVMAARSDFFKNYVEKNYAIGMRKAFAPNGLKVKVDRTWFPEVGT